MALGRNKGTKQATKRADHRQPAALVHLDVQEESERVIDAIQATVQDAESHIGDVQEHETMTRLALKQLGSGMTLTRRDRGAARGYAAVVGP
jgi:hypothetical protein